MYAKTRIVFSRIARIRAISDKLLVFQLSNKLKPRAGGESILFRDLQF